MRRMFSSKWPKILTFSHKSTKGMKMSIEIPDEVLVLEGIHALNDELTS